MNLKSRDGIIGLALADAMGVPVEFMDRELLKFKPVTTVIGNGTYDQPAGTFSDDTSLLLGTMDGIIRNGGKLDVEAYYKIADNFASYYTFGSFTPDENRFDIGNTTKGAIVSYIDGQKPWLAGGNMEFNKGNGALMRILPLAYYAEENNLSDKDTYVIVNLVSSITHRLPHCILGSYIYVNFARKLLQGFSKEKAYEDIPNHDYSPFEKDVMAEYNRILKGKIYECSEDDISSRGVTVDTLEAALWSFMRNDSYDDSILQAINLGEDSDTVGCVTGGLAGIYYGYNSINPEWLKALRRKDYIESLCAMFDESIKTKTVPKDPKGLLTECLFDHDLDKHFLSQENIKTRVLRQPKHKRENKGTKYTSRELDEK